MIKHQTQRSGIRIFKPLASLLPIYILAPLVALLLITTPHALIENLSSRFVLMALWLTLKTTLIATVLCVALGTPVAYVLARSQFRGRGLVDTLIDLPMTIPPVVAGVALLLAFGRQGLIGKYIDLAGLQIPFTMIAVVMAQVFIASPFYVRAARAGFESVDATLEDTAGTLGATPWKVFWTVTVPLARPSLIAGIVIAWARALSEFGATMMFAGNLPGRTQTLPLAVMSSMEMDLGTAAAISIVSLIMAVAALLIAKRLAGRHSAVF